LGVAVIGVRGRVKYGRLRQTSNGATPAHKRHIGDRGNGDPEAAQYW